MTSSDKACHRQDSPFHGQAVLVARKQFHLSAPPVGLSLSPGLHREEGAFVSHLMACRCLHTLSDLPVSSLFLPDFVPLTPDAVSALALAHILQFVSVPLKG